MNEESKHPGSKEEKAQRIGRLIAKHLQGSLTPRENEELSDWIGESDNNVNIFQELIGDQKIKEGLDWMSNEEHTLQKMEELKKGIDFKKSQQRRFIIRPLHYAIAALFLLAVASTIFLLSSDKKGTTDKIVKQDLPPGSTDKAILTLNDGSTIMLDQAKDGKLTTQGNSDVSKQQGKITYSNREGKTNADVLYNTISTPRGGSYSLSLSDGTKIWLNAASSIRFPVVFTGPERKVIITGEVYFEVQPATNRSKEKLPFIVEIKDRNTLIEVLGTAFNINAYADEPIIKTTLVEGAVKLKASGKTSMLKPNQQAQVNERGEIKTIPNANVESELAWKRNMFHFSDTDLRTIMKQLSRWYDVEIQYETTANPRYASLFYRDLPASKIFEVLEESGGVHFKIEGKKIKVLP